MKPAVTAARATSAKIIVFLDAHDKMPQPLWPKSITWGKMLFIRRNMFCWAKIRLC
jgi:hypothetical protein